ncbi:MAG TPA: hypothetical protein VLT51_05720 [Anaerolineales bacterium]|nr:hypothetical protein [Anaerolineales bacterium]
MNVNHRDSVRAAYLFSYSLSAILLVGYVVVYMLYPFEGSWNDILLNTITAISSAFAAGIATSTFLHYEKDDMPRIVWQNLTIACWLWFVGEVIWGYFYVTLGDIPTGAADWTWVLGFIFFTLALYHQYILIAPSRKNFYRNIAIGAWVVVLLIPLAIVYFTNTLDLQSYIDFYYPFADLAVGIAGVMLMFAFQGGTLMLPWLGLVVFSITDFLYAWAEKTGVYAWSSENSNLLTLFIDTSYLAAYLILALGFLGHWILIRYGIQATHDHD